LQRNGRRGYFEVTENTGNTGAAAYAAGPITPLTGATPTSGPRYAQPYLPDGYRLVRELGSDMGQVRRNKAFYLIDRSIPVGFEPGVNHNVEDAILLRRYVD